MVSAQRVCVLGPVTVETATGGIGLPGANARALMAALALAAPAARSADAVAADVWGDDLPQNPRAAVQTLVSRVRASAGADAVRSTPAGYALGVPETDLATARRLADEAERVAAGDPARLVLLDRACALWRGEPGSDLEPRPVGDAVRDAAAALRGRLEASRAQALIAAGRPGDAAAVLAELAAAQPFDEVVHGELMSALASAGHVADALAVFAALRVRLRDELGSSPGAPLAELNATLLRGQSRDRARLRIGLHSAPNDLLGRDGDVTAVTGLLAAHRVITVLGTGGLGKTRLVQAVAAASDAPAVVVVPLAGVRADGDVAPAIAATLGISEASPGDRLADVRLRPDLRVRVVSLLAEQATLLVLDNCEQVIDGVAAWVADMLGAVRSLRVLTTSRTPLAVAGEAVYPLEPLAVAGAQAPAVRLFLERARAVRPGASLPIDVVTRLCAHLDGLPLAIELAAARVRTMTAQQIEGRLTDRFALLTTGDRAAPERHRTLEAVIGWSWDLLDVPARRALAVLAVLPDGFGAGTAAAVLGEPVDDVLDRLVSQSLLLVVEQDAADVRFRMLETIREFALVRLAAQPGGADAGWERVTAWARVFCAERLGRAFERAAHAEILAEHDNLIAVLRRAIDVGDRPTTVLLFALLAQTWLVQGAFTEMGAFAPAAFEAVGRVREADVPVEAVVITLIFGLFLTQNAPGQGMLRVVARVRVLYRRHRDMDPLIGAFAEAFVTVIQAGATGGRARVTAALDAMRGPGDLPRRLVGESLRSQWAENEGEPQVALDAAMRVWELTRDTDAEWFAVMSASSIAQLASQLAQPRRALEWLDRADEGYERFGADQQQRQSVWLRAANLLALGDRDAAGELFGSLASTAELTQDGLAAASIGLYGLAEIERAGGDRDAAAALFERALERFGSAAQRGSPWYLMAMAGALSAAVLDDLLPASRRSLWARRLRGRTRAILRLRPEMSDHPVLGVVLIGWSAWAIGDAGLPERGLRSLALGERLGARQDLPSLHWDVHRAYAARVCGADALQAAVAEASALPHGVLLERTAALLAEPIPGAAEPAP